MTQQQVASIRAGTGTLALILLAMLLIAGCTTSPSAGHRTGGSPAVASGTDTRPAGAGPGAVIPVDRARCAEPIGNPERVVSDTERKARLHVQLAQKYMGNGAYEIALQEIDKSLKIDNSIGDAYHAKAILQDRFLGQPTAAAASYAKALRMEPGDPRLQNNYGQFLCKHGHYQQAQAYFACALDNPFYTTPEVAYLNAGTCGLLAGDTERARTSYLAVLQLQPNSADALLGMAEVMLDRQEYPAARAYFDRYLKVGSLTPRALWLGIRIERGNGDRDRLASYELLLRKKYPASPEAAQLSGG